MHIFSTFQRRSRYRFEKIVKKSGEDRYCKHFTAWKQFLTLLFAQISGKDSLREIENAVMSQILVAMIHYLLVAYIKFLHGFKLGMTELTNRIRRNCHHRHPCRNAFAGIEQSTGESTGIRLCQQQETVHSRYVALWR